MNAYVFFLFLISYYCLELIASSVLTMQNDAGVFQAFQSVVPIYDLSCLSGILWFVEQLSEVVNLPMPVFQEQWKEMG